MKVEGGENSSTSSDDEEDDFDENWESKKSHSFGKRQYSDSINCLIIIKEITKLVDKKLKNFN